MCFERILTLASRKRKLQQLVQDQKRITSTEQQWLDEEGNDVEETKLIDDLEKAADYEQKLARKLDSALVSFCRELRIKESKSLVPTKMTDCFQRK